MQSDPASVAGKQPPIGESTDLLIIGAGPAGMAAALAAAGRGVRVTLVDENPIPLRAMGEEVPLHFGGRMAATLANHNAVLDQILAANPRLGDAMEAGVDVRVGTVAWGLFPPHRTAAWLGGFVVGLADESRGAWLMRVGQVIVAAGRRDMGLAFEGWQLPGVMGATAAHRLATLYNALESKEAVLVGSDAEALQIGNALLDAGVRIAAIVEQAKAVVGPEHLLSRLVSRGARVFTGCVIQRAHGDQRGVTSIELGRESIACDTVLLAVGAIPAIELLDSCGCAVSFQAERGGHVPNVDRWQRTSLPLVLAAGDCAGIWPSKSLSEAVARREGRIAAAAALRALGIDSAEESAVQPDVPMSDIAARRVAWVRASVLESHAQPFVCQCEEVTAQEILELRPPRYLRWKGAVHPESGCPASRHWRFSGFPPLRSGCSPDAVKRLTRAGMGPCQGRRCREQVAALVALDSNTALAEVPLATYRAPVRPLSLRQLASVPEAPATGEHWDSWFGMPSQWVPFWRIGMDEPQEGCECAPVVPRKSSSVRASPA
jgi:thioredoxin reductase